MPNKKTKPIISLIVQDLSPFSVQSMASFQNCLWAMVGFNW